MPTARNVIPSTSGGVSARSSRKPKLWTKKIFGARNLSQTAQARHVPTHVLLSGLDHYLVHLDQEIPGWSARAALLVCQTSEAMREGLAYVELDDGFNSGVLGIARKSNGRCHLVNFDGVEVRNNDLVYGPMRVVALIDVLEEGSRYFSDVMHSPTGFQLDAGEWKPAELPQLPDFDPSDPNLTEIDIAMGLLECQFDLFEREWGCSRGLQPTESFTYFFDRPLASWARRLDVRDLPSKGCYSLSVGRDRIVGEWQPAYLLEPIARPNVVNGQLCAVRLAKNVLFLGIGLGEGIIHLLGDDGLLKQHVDGNDLNGVAVSVNEGTETYAVVGVIGRKALRISRTGFTANPALTGLDRLIAL